MKKSLLVAACISVMALFGCSDAQVASSNISKSADSFEINRRIVFYNGITDAYIFMVEGKCSISQTKRKLQVTCKVGDNEFKRHQLGLSDNVTYLAEHLEPTNVSTYHHRIVFKPQTLIPEIDMRFDKNELTENKY